MKKIVFSFCCLILFTPLLCLAQAGKKATDYLKVPGPVSIGNLSYKLNWSSHPADNYYKQEYLPAGETTGKFKNMLVIDVLITGATVKELAGQKIEELKQMKQSNPMVNFNSFENAASGEYMLDFLVTANNPDGSISIIERNVYRYKAINTSNGKKAILLVGISQREYGNKADAFLSNLSTNKNQLVNTVAKFALPAIGL